MRKEEQLETDFNQSNRKVRVDGVIYIFTNSEHNEHQVLVKFPCSVALDGEALS